MAQVISSFSNLLIVILVMYSIFSAIQLANLFVMIFHWNKLRPTFRYTALSALFPMMICFALSYYLILTYNDQTFCTAGKKITYGLIYINYIAYDYHQLFKIVQITAAIGPKLYFLYFMYCVRIVSLFASEANINGALSGVVNNVGSCVTTMDTSYIIQEHAISLIYESSLIAVFALYIREHYKTGAVKMAEFVRKFLDFEVMTFGGYFACEIAYSICYWVMPKSYLSALNTVYVNLPIVMFLLNALWMVNWYDRNQRTEDQNMPLVRQIKRFIPTSETYKATKGEAGRIGVIGGSIEYTGAPYFAAMAALRTGADLAHVFCVRDAAPVIKSYSPELIVHPYLFTEKDVDGNLRDKTEECVFKIEKLLDRLDVLIIGPGLSRDSVILNTATQIIKRAKRISKPIIIDADGLYLVQQNPDLLDEYKNCVLTPNFNEFNRLKQALSISDKLERDAAAKIMSKLLGGVTIISKGEMDIIACGEKGSLLLKSYYQCHQRNGPFENDSYIEYFCGYAASRLLRESAQTTFEQKGRSMVTGDILANIGPQFSKIFEEKDRQESRQ
ncbi:hypothetical protein HK103_007532 [Boothiomyces macroporosus]|uniref:ATP-dependent (S)-NAD(P)H-hydrate dehydratase n=1 Tax=Boothiomyces macroporosus TaxID=261099 RepID=A0AAD5UCX1_9FUNG|nr:hypothetical protein HK103_007532 [Boothiomyces macroporosus]